MFNSYSVGFMNFCLRFFLTFVCCALCLTACQNGEKDNAAIEGMFKKGVRHTLNADEFLAASNVAEAEKEFKLSVEVFNNVLTMDSTHFGAVGGLGYSYYQLGEFDKAVEHLRRATVIDPKFAENHRLLGLALINFGDLLEGGREIQYAHQLDRDTAYFRRSMRDLEKIGQTAFEKGNRLDATMGRQAGRSYQHFAVGVFILAHDLEPTNQYIIKAIVEMCNKIGDTATAEVYEKKLR